MRLAAKLGYSLNAFRERGTMTPFLGTGRSVGVRDLCSGVGWTLGEALPFGVDATRSGSAPLAAAGDFASVAPDEPAAYDQIAAVRADGPGSATLVRLMTVESGRSVLRAANPGRPDVEVTHTNERMIRAVVVFVGRAV